jgi:hypothetical protein
MAHLPIKRMTLYKHGVGFFERRAELSTERVELSFRVEDMNDILKSLTAIDWGGGQVLGIDYATPQSRDERLAGCSIRLDDDASLQDLLVSLRGRRVILHLDQGETATGTLLGLDAPTERQPLATALVSLLREDADRVDTAALARVQGVEILDEQGASDLRFFLQTALSQESFRSVTVRLTPGEHDLSVSYIAPAPTWRVSYRLVAEPDEDGPASGRALIQGWGIFDNRLEEDLEGIALSLVAGMPISFIYDLYTPFTPERPVVEEEARVAAAPVQFAQARSFPEERESYMAAPSPMALGAGMDHVMARRAPARMDIAAVEQAAAVETSGQALGELFQYTIGTPVTVGRGQSAMVPIVQAGMPYGKDLLYNGRKLPAHPVATLRLKNETGLTLERGPVTVIERGEYVGEALLPFTVVDSEIVVPYAVELGVKVNEKELTTRETRGLEIKGAFLQFEEWEIRRRDYTVENDTAKPVMLLIEHPRLTEYELFDSPEPVETTGNHLRFQVEVAARREAALQVRERRLTHRREELRRQSYAGLQRYLRQGLLKQRDLDELTRLLKLWEGIADQEQRLGDLQKERDKLYKAQQQIQGNMQALGQAGKEGALRARYVEQLEASEAQLRAIEKQEAEARAQIERIQREIDAQLKRLA